MVKCRLGEEKQTVLQLMRKFIAYQFTDTPLQIKSVVSPEGVKGYIYIEAFKQTHVKQAIDQISSLRMGQYAQQMVPIKEMTDVLRVVKEQSILKPKAWVRLKRGIYKDDIAQVDFVDVAQNQVQHLFSDLFSSLKFCHKRIIDYKNLISLWAGSSKADTTHRLFSTTRCSSDTTIGPGGEEEAQDSATSETLWRGGHPCHRRRSFDRRRFPPFWIESLLTQRISLQELHDECYHGRWCQTHSDRTWTIRRSTRRSWHGGSLPFSFLIFQFSVSNIRLMEG